MAAFNEGDALAQSGDQPLQGGYVSFVAGRFGWHRFAFWPPSAQSLAWRSRGETPATTMPTYLYRLACFALVFAVSGCAGKRSERPWYRRIAVGSDRFATGRRRRGARRGEAAIDGLFPSVPGDRTCCWVATSASLRARKVAPAKYLDLTIYVPDYPFFERRPQSLTVTVEHGVAQRRCCFAPGTHKMRFELTPRLQTKTGTLRVFIRSRYSFVPAAERVNAHTRSLGVVVSRIDFRS